MFATIIQKTTKKLITTYDVLSSQLLSQLFNDIYFYGSGEDQGPPVPAIKPEKTTFMENLQFPSLDN